MIISIEKKTGRSTSRAAARTVVATVLPAAPRHAATPRRWAMLSAMMTAPSTMMPKSMAPIDSRPIGMSADVHQHQGEQQRERNGQRHQQRHRRAAQEQQQHQHAPA